MRNVVPPRLRVRVLTVAVSAIALGGTWLVFGASTGAQATVTQSRAVARPASTSVTDLIGHRGVIRVHSWGAVQIARAEATAWEEVPVVRIRSGHEGEIAEFVAAIREGRPPSVTGEDGALAVETVLAIYQASASGTVVSLPLPPS